jgi:hypothetical protein
MLVFNGVLTNLARSLFHSVAQASTLPSNVTFKSDEEGVFLTVRVQDEGQDEGQDHYVTFKQDFSYFKVLVTTEGEPARVPVSFGDLDAESKEVNVDGLSECAFDVLKQVDLSLCGL